MSPNLLRVFGGVKIALASLSALVPMELFLLCILGYLIGSIPTGYLLMKYAAGKDIRELGSHSTGATNVLRSGNKTLALLTLLGDALKGIFFTLTLKLFFAAQLGTHTQFGLHSRAVKGLRHRLAYSL